MRGPVRARHEPELPLQAPGGRRGTRRRRPPSVAQRGRSLSLEVVDHRVVHRRRRVLRARRGAVAAAAVAGPGGAVRRVRPARRARRAILRIQPGPASMARREHGGGRARLAGCDGPLASRQQLELLGRGDAPLRGRGGGTRPRVHLLGPARSDASPARRASRRFGGVGLRGLGRGDQSGVRRRDRRIAMDRPRAVRRNLLLLRLGPQPPGWRGSRGDRRHLRGGQHVVHPGRRSRLRRSDGTRPARGRRAHRRVRPGPRRRRPDARAGTRGTLGRGPDSGLKSGGCAATHNPPCARCPAGRPDPTAPRCPPHPTEVARSPGAARDWPRGRTRRGRRREDHKADATTGERPDEVWQRGVLPGDHVAVAEQVGVAPDRRP